MTITVKIKKGKHYPNLSSLLKTMWLSIVKPKYIYVAFDDASKYDLGTNDNYDWSKLVGRGGVLYGRDGGQGYPTRKNEQFLVWRYIPEKDEFHVADNYQRINHKMQLPITWDILEGGGVVRVSTKYLKSFIPIGSYFGGNMEAPNDVTYKITW